MITFLPYVDFRLCAKVLDDRRLGMQRVEAHHILRAITGKGPARKHPAIEMWQPYPRALLEYAYLIVFEWQRRGFEDNTLSNLNGDFMALNCQTVVRPSWLGAGRLHSSHRAALLAKDPQHYGKFGWKVQPAINYYWPTRNDEQTVEDPL